VPFRSDAFEKIMPQDRPPIAGRPKIVTVPHNDYTGPEMVHPDSGITDQIPERCLYTIPVVSAKRFHVAYPTGPDHP
jgi:hypothetical protein